MKKVPVLLVFLMTLAGCRNHDTTPAEDSPIVTTVERAGAGDLASVGQAGIQRWLNAHEDVAKQIAQPCKEAGVHAPASWSASTEGRVCAADAVVMFTMPTTLYKPY